MLKWVLGLCASMYLTLLVFGAPPEGEAVASTQETSVVRIIADTEVSDASAATPASTDLAAEVAPTEPATTPLVAATPATEPAIVPAAFEPATTEASLASPLVEVASLDAAAPVTEAVTAPAAVTPVAVETPQSDKRGAGEIWTVTGSTVNLREFASIQGAVLGQATRGDSAEVIELLDNGWAHVYVIERGLEAYISAKFLTRQQG